jgi:hypothetical protein
MCSVRDGVIGDSLASGADLTWSEDVMTPEQFKSSAANEAPDPKLPAPLAALWWDVKGDWARAHSLVDDLESREGMAVHAYLHRKEGSDWNADYWYRRSGRGFHRPELDAEWAALVEFLITTLRP